MLTIYNGVVNEDDGVSIPSTTQIRKIICASLNFCMFAGTDTLRNLLSSQNLVAAKLLKINT